MDLLKLKHLWHVRHKSGFDNICEYADVKDVINRALDCEDSFNLLLCGPPASSKTLFLLGIVEREPNAVLFDGSNSTNRILDVLEEERPKIICLDEADKLQRPFQEKLLTFLENGRVKVDQVKRSYDFVIPGAKLFATANNIDRLSKPLQSRFRKLYLPPYTREQFLDVAVKVSSKLKEETARMIGAEVWNSSKDVRDVISITKLIRRGDNEQDVKQISETMTKYANPGES